MLSVEFHHAGVKNYMYFVQINNNNNNKTKQTKQQQQTNKQTFCPTILRKLLQASRYGKVIWYH